MTTVLARAIIDRLGDLSQFFTLPTRALAAVMGMNTRVFDDEVRARALEEARRELGFIEAQGIRALFFTDPDYPQRLLECADAPLMIYGYGDTDLNRARFISIVGTRHATAYGSRFVQDTVPELASLMADPLVVVSGLAYGIDITAHRAALDAHIPTVAVLAHGLNTIYPASHRDTAIRMVRDGGMLLTDYRSIDTVHRGNFLARNRIVAGLSDCLLVAESDTRGGAMVTARLASAYDRDVFALPGRYTDRFSRGCNSLIGSHVAQSVTSAADVLHAMNWPERPDEGTQPQLIVELTTEEEAVMEVLVSRGEATLNQLLATVDTPPHRLMGLLIDMEARGLLMSLPGATYRPLR